jgi:hypothetical protein
MSFTDRNMREQTMSYEGWKTWQTWNTASWCDKDKLIHRDRMRRRPRTAEECEAFVRDWFPNGTPDMTTNRDPYGAHVREAVDWQDIADHWKDDYGEEDTT